MADLVRIFRTTKEIGRFSKWSDPECETNYIWFQAPIEVEGTAEPGLTLHGGCYVDQPDRHLTFELRLLRTPGRGCIPLERLDWRSLTGHSNPARAGSEWSRRRVSNTHLHDFYLNYSEADKRMRNGNLRIARAICRQLSSFSEVTDFIGERLNIVNMDVVNEPKWVYDLFPGGAL